MLEVVHPAVGHGLVVGSVDLGRDGAVGRLVDVLARGGRAHLVGDLVAARADVEVSLVGLDLAQLARRRRLHRVDRLARVDGRGGRRDHERADDRDDRDDADDDAAASGTARGSSARRSDDGWSPGARPGACRSGSRRVAGSGWSIPSAACRRAWCRRASTVVSARSRSGAPRAAAAIVAVDRRRSPALAAVRWAKGSVPARSASSRASARRDAQGSLSQARTSGRVRPKNRRAAKARDDQREQGQGRQQQQRDRRQRERRQPERERRATPPCAGARAWS